MKTKKQYLSSCQLLYGMYSTNEFLKRCMSFAIQNRDFFFDVLTVDDKLRSLYNFFEVSDVSR